MLAAVGVGLHQITGQPGLRRPASVAIAVLLTVVAFTLGRDTKALLVGSSATPEERQAICSILDARPEVDRVVELLTMALAPEQLLVAARVDLADGLSTDEVEKASSEIDRELRERVPGVWQVFLDATHGSESRGRPAAEAARPGVGGVEVASAEAQRSSSCRTRYAPASVAQPRSIRRPHGALTPPGRARR